MSIIIKFLILYLIPVVSFLGSLAVYLHANGKPPENTYINITFIFVALGFIASCYIAIGLISHFVSADIVYSGILFTVLPWVIELVVLSLYFIVFYGLFNP